ncbi:hypothetical protein ACHAWX_001890 [Stephanocyclus meneghinianus]
MARFHLKVLLCSSLSARQRRCLSFSPASLRSSIHPPFHTTHGALFQEQSSARSSTEAATTSSSLDNDSSYEALRRKFGLFHDSTINSDDAVDEKKQEKSDTVADVNEQPESETSVSLPTLQTSIEVIDERDLIVDSLESQPPLVQLSSSSPFDDSTQTEDLQQDTSATLDSSYSRKFTRYNIPLTTYNDSKAKADMKKEIEQRKQRRLGRGIIVKLKPSSQATQTNLFNGLFQRGIDLSESILSTPSFSSTKTLDTRIEKAYSGRSFRWVTSESIRKAENNNVRLLDEDFVAAAAFWRMAADISQREMEITRGDDSEFQERNRQNQQWYLALPETTCTLAQHLCDIINWYADYLKNSRENATVILRARLDTTHSNSIPIVEFTAEYHRQRSESNRITSHETKPTSDDTERRTKSWVKRLLVQLGVCPFTKSNVKSGQGLGDVGVPVANIMYRHSGASCVDHGTSGEIYTLMAVLSLGTDTWEAISDMIAAGPSGKDGVSSILLSAPSFDDDFALWAGPVFAMLEAGVGAIQAEEIIGVVCFHPKYATPDGTSFPGFGHMHSLPRLKKWYNEFTSSGPLTDNEIAAGGAWQRRTPHAVINVLRAEQLEAAEGRRGSGILYERNIRVLVGREEGVGSDKLEQDLKREQSMKV